MKKNVTIGIAFIDRAWELQHRLEDLGRRFLIKNPPGFLAALTAFSFLCYAMAIWLYFTFIDPVNILTTGKIPALLNPVQMIFFAFLIFLMLFLDKKGILD